MSEGTTLSEKYLVKLCRRSFLRLWSWPNLYRDQKWGAGNEGKEVCDLLVVFGSDVIIFSDKLCKFPSTGNIQVDWSRWFKRAVWKSAQQIWGAERWINSYPEKLWVDSGCTKRLPIAIPPTSERRVHRIVVAHGSGERCRSTLGGTGSLAIMPSIVGKQHFERPESAMPFAVGVLDSDKGFVHVIDDFTLDTLLNTLDTAPDFVRYLEHKEDLISSQKLGSAAGEEELLAFYLKHADADGQHHFPVPAQPAVTIIDEGFWEDFCNSKERIAQLASDEVSYTWDRLIEAFTHHLLEDTQYFKTHSSISEFETALRIMAREPRTKRRMLSRSLIAIMNRANTERRSARVLSSPVSSDPVYVFLALERRDQESQAEYREIRRDLLQAYCMVTRYKLRHAKEIVGIATEPSRVRARITSVFER